MNRSDAGASTTGGLSPARQSTPTITLPALIGAYAR